MSWFSKKDKQDKPEPAQPQVTGTFSINDMMKGPPSTLSDSKDDPAWVATEDEVPDDLQTAAGFTDLDFAEMRRQRLKREAKPTFTERLQQGDVQVGLGRATGGFVSLGNFLMKPFLMVAENTNVLMGGVLILILLGFVALGGVEALEWYVSDM